MSRVRIPSPAPTLFPLTASPLGGLSTLVLPQPVGCARRRQARLWVPAWPDLRYGTIACDEPPHVPDPAAVSRAAAAARTAVRGRAVACPCPRQPNRLLRPALAGAGGGRLENRVRGRWRGSAPERAPAAGGQSARARSVCAAGTRAGRLLHFKCRGARVSPPVRRSIIVYAWKDPLHFDYVHLSTDAAQEQPVHNGVFHVYGGDRVRISTDEGPRSLADALGGLPSGLFTTPRKDSSRRGSMAAGIPRCGRRLQPGRGPHRPRLVFQHRQFPQIRAAAGRVLTA